MVAKMKPVNVQSSNLETFSGRLVAERERLRLTQIELRERMGVSKASQIRYESGDSSPDADYLAELDAIGVDVMYLLTGVRRSDALSDELQNLVEAYMDADESTQQAVFGVLVARFSDDVRRARKTPGWYRHELAGEDDPRYGKYPPADLTPLRLQDGPALPDPGGPDTPDVDSTQPDPNPTALPGEVGRRRPPRRR